MSAKILATFLALLSSLLLTVVEVGSAQSQSQSVAPAPAAPAPAQAFVLQDGTPVKLRLSRNLSSADARTGEEVDFDVLEEIKVNNVVVVPKGATAMATVTEAQAKRRMGRGGKLDVNIDYVRLADGEKAALRAVKEVAGGGHAGAMTGAMVATSLVVWPAAPFFLFMHGKDITIPKGTEISAYTNGDMSLDVARFTATPPAPAAGLVAVSATASDSKSNAQLEITSQPPGADIDIDGSFVGSTPSSVGVSPGQHNIRVKKAGFKPWSRQMSVSSGHISVAAELER